MRAEILHEHQSLVYESQLQVVELEAEDKTKNKLTTMEVDIISQTQKANWSHMEIEAIEKEKAQLNASELDSIEEKLVEAVNAGLEHARTTRLLEVEVEKLRVDDRLADRKLERPKLRFEELKSKLKSYG